MSPRSIHGPTALEEAIKAEVEKAKNSPIVKAVEKILTAECAYCQTEIPNVDPGHAQFCSDECKAEYASEQPGYRSDRDVYREEAPYGVE